MQYLMSLWISLHKRGIQAILLAGCLLGFGLGQTLAASGGLHADHADHAPLSQVGASGVTSRTGGGLGNSVATQQGAGATKTVKQTQHATATQQAAHVSPSQDHQASKDGNKGKEGENGSKKHSKTRGHRTGNSGGPDSKRSKDSGNQKYNVGGERDGGSGHTGHGRGWSNN